MRSPAYNDEILSVCIRFVDSSKRIQEEYLEFIFVERIMGEYLFEKIFQFYENVKMNISDIHDQCYDGASNMSSSK